MGALLLEIGTEEVPSGYILPALRQMEDLLKEGLKNNRLSFAGVEVFGTPRRLGLYAQEIPQRQPPLVEEVQGPSKKVAFDPEGRPTKAAMGFARAQGVDFKDLQLKETPKGSYLFAIKTHEGEETIRLLPDLLLEIIRSLSFPKKMKWRGPGLLFARPIRWIVALYDNQVVELEINGLRSSRTTFGHPFLSGKKFELRKADLKLYKDLLRKEKVIVDVEERKALLRERLEALLSRYDSWLRDEELLEEVTNLVEYPFPVECTFPEEFLKVPKEVVETVMREHQRYFPVEDGSGRLLPRFIVVTNRSEKEAPLAIEGNERVLRARLADAKFFWEEDRKRSLWDRLEGLKDVVFHEKLGSYWERTERIESLSKYLADKFGLSTQERVSLEWAAKLCKADLLTQMVGEFPNLQGIIGYHYAKEQGESEEVAMAIMEHYLPRYAGDRLPETKLGTILSLADKFDSLCACFSIGLVPTGSQDPYALRRQAQGIVRILGDKRLPLSLQEAVTAALENFPGAGAATREILDFFRDRLYQTFLERGYRYDILNAVLGANFDNVGDFYHRLEVITQFSKTPEWQGLVTVVERTFNIGKDSPSMGEVEEALLQEIEERRLWETYLKNKDHILSLINAERYEEASREYYTAFAQTVHTFFDKVFVNVDDTRLRNNRLLLIKNINELYSKRIADLSQIVPPVAPGDGQ